jgi:hypothetical protein
MGAIPPIATAENPPATQTGSKATEPKVRTPIAVALDPGAIESEFRDPIGRERLLRWLPSRTHDNGVLLAFSNGVGEDDGEVRTGNAMIIDCYGRIIAETWEAKDKLAAAEADLDLLPLSTGRRWLRWPTPRALSPIDRARRQRGQSATSPLLRGAGRPPRKIPHRRLSARLRGLEASQALLSLWTAGLDPTGPSASHARPTGFGR